MGLLGNVGLFGFEPLIDGPFTDFVGLVGLNGLAGLKGPFRDFVGLKGVPFKALEGLKGFVGLNGDFVGLKGVPPFWDFKGVAPFNISGFLAAGGLSGSGDVGWTWPIT